MENFNQTSLVDLGSYEEPQVELPEDDLEIPQFGEDYEQKEAEQPLPESEVEDYITKFLNANNVNRNEIHFTNEDGQDETVRFDDLSDDEKLELLTSISEIPITDQEIETLNFLRKNRLNLAEYVEGQKQKAIEDYLKQNNSYNYTVDSLTDDELYAFELKDKYPDLTDEEIKAEVDYAKENQELYNKKINSLRAEYKKLEEDQLAEQNKQQEAEREQEWNDFAETVVNVARNTSEMHDLLLEDEDKEEVLSFLLDKDGNGQTKFIKLLEDPAQLFNLAWYATKGADAFKQMQDYYRNEITKSRRQTNAPKKTIRRDSSQANNETFDLDSYFNK